MNMEDILNSGANVTLTIKSTDLKEFAEHLVKKTVRSIRDSFIRPEEDYLTIKEASQILHTDKSTLWRWHKIGYLCRLEIGGKRLYRKSDVELFYRKRIINPLNFTIMSLIKKSNELVIPTTVKMMIYGQAGMGKSTVALSAPKPLLLDFDNGVKRMNMAHLENIDTVQVTSWSDVQQVLQEDLSAYQTIVVDTIGKMMDFIITYKCGSRQPSIRDWSGINAEFSWMTRTLSGLNKHIIFVAHRDTRKEGDDTVFIPALREKSYNSIVTELDLLGYLEMKSERGVQRRTITFDPTSRNDGKNTCNLPSVMEVPTILDKNGNPTAKNDFITAKIINSYLGMLAAKKEAQEKYDKVIEEIKESIEFITDASSANEFASHINEFEHVGSSLMMARSLFAAKVKALGLVFNKETKIYSDAA